MGKEKCYECWWLEKYGIDFLKNRGLVTKESLAEFLNIGLDTLEHNMNYKLLVKLMKENDL